MFFPRQGFFSVSSLRRDVAFRRISFKRITRPRRPVGERVKTFEIRVKREGLSWGAGKGSGVGVIFIYFPFSERLGYSLFYLSSVKVPGL